MSLHRVCRGFLRAAREARSTHAAREARSTHAAREARSTHAAREARSTHASTGRAAAAAAGPSGGFEYSPAEIASAAKHGTAAPWQGPEGTKGIQWPIAAACVQPLWPSTAACAHALLHVVSLTLSSHAHPQPQPQPQPQQLLPCASPLLASARHASNAWTSFGAIRTTPAVDSVRGISAVRSAPPQRPALHAQLVPVLPARLLSTAAAGTAPPSPPRRSWLAVALLLLPCATAFGLGAWQIQRYYWKLDLVERRQQRLQEPPVPLLDALQAHALATGEEAALPLLPPPPATSPAAAGPHGSGSAADGSGSAADGPGLAAEGPGWAAGELEFRRVECAGRYDDARSLFVGPRAHTVRGAQEKGYFLVTPLVPPPGSQQPAVLVNRGWVPEAVRREADTWMAGERARGAAGEVGKEEVESGGSGTSRSGGGGSSSSGSSSSGDVSEKGSTRGWFGSGGGTARASTGAGTALGKPNAPPVIHVSGVVRGSEKPNHFVPPNAPEHGEWFWVDVPAMAQACGLPRGTLLLDAMKPTEDEEDEKERTSDSSSSSSSGQAGVCPAFSSDPRFPRPKDPEELVKLPVMPTDHITYAATWFSLFTATSVMAYKRLRVVPKKVR